MSKLTYSILQLLWRSEKGLTFNVLCGRTGEEERTVRTRLQLLQSQELVVMKGGRWYLTSTGQIAAEGEAMRRSQPLYARGWQALRMLKAAGISDIAMMAARVEEKTAASVLTGYFQTLSRVGLVVRAGAVIPPRFALIDDLGPEAPRIDSRRHVVIEPNSGRELPMPWGKQKGGV
ncbi:hypothetical protein [Jeongeupia chitinilytica]|uniref:Transcriptional regulator n=1 Tax=Jeongeupia chitinilytica TaxID=1041641 RepID=A0ABQ3H1Y6_9NEIS|nr:hypothetical protein [Jeongeupia chitinilytica]GHD63749.1 hypothetical protein GCM10007350_21860 [Jeongeupia chitinilytica]